MFYKEITVISLPLSYYPAERTRATLGCMGAAVLNGGFSTFLAFILLAASNSYIFTTFFKVEYY